MIQDKNTQTRDVYRHLVNNGSITSLEAIYLYGATRLAALIKSMKRQGYPITVSYEKMIVRDRTVRIARYSLEDI